MVLLFFRESIVILLSVKMATVRYPFLVMYNVSIVSCALTMASCFAWLLERFLSCLKSSCARSSFPIKIATPDPTSAHSCYRLCITGSCIPCFLSLQ